MTTYLLFWLFMNGDIAVDHERFHSEDTCETKVMALKSLFPHTNFVCTRVVRA